MKSHLTTKYLISQEKIAEKINSEFDALTHEQKEKHLAKIKKLLKDRHAVLIAHFYVAPEIQKLAEETGGFVGDSLEMAKFGSQNPATTLIIAGVRFMGETAKIINPDKRIIMPNLAADCSLALSCSAKDFANFIKKHPHRTKVVYVNTSAEIKALADWTVTSSVAVDIINYLQKRKEKLIWAPDKYLGNYLKKITQADMLIWSGSCVVHEKFKVEGIKKLKKLYPNAALLVHPESPPATIAIADVVGSTSQLLAASTKLPYKIFIVATDSGILYKMQQKSPRKVFISAPTYGKGATCVSCAHCPWMAMNSILNLEEALETCRNEIILTDEIIHQAQIPIKRMLEFAHKR